MVAAAALIAATTLLAKALGTPALGPPLPAFQVAWGRFAFAAMAVASVCALLRPRIGLAHLRWHVLRVLCGWGGVTAMFAAVATIPLAEATAISFLNPVVAMLLAVPLLGERPGPVRWAASAVALLGAAILLRPGAGAVAPGALLALLAALLLGAEVLLIKRLTRVEGRLAILAFSNGIGLILASATAWPVWQAPTGAQWAGMAALGLAMAAAQGCFVTAMARAEASYVAPFTYLTLVFAAAYDAALFGVLPDAVAWAGALLIVAGAVILAWREGRASDRRP
jgi:drug/metabolite transporter (DMT)-like permease